MNDEQWLAELLRKDYSITSSNQVILRNSPWSVVYRISSTQGAIFVKKVSGNLAYEVELTVALRKLFPEVIPFIHGYDVSRCILVMADGGTPLRECISCRDELHHLDEVLRQYARLQLKTTDISAELLKKGVPDRRLEAMPLLYSSLLSRRELLIDIHLGKGAGLTNEQLNDAHRKSSALSSLSGQLASAGIPATLHHDDFHDANILVHPKGIHFIDWGEASIAHPFYSLLIMQRSLSFHLKLDSRDPSLMRLIDLYLEMWEDYGSKKQLREAFTIAQKLAVINRCFTWISILSGLSLQEQGKDFDTVAAWLKEWLTAAA